MSWPEALNPLCEALLAEAEALDVLRKDLMARRRDFSAPRPSTVSRAVDDLEPLVNDLAKRAQQRATHCAAVCRALSLPEQSTAKQIAARLAPQTAGRLRAAAAQAHSAAARLRVENAVGAELLDLSARVQEGIWQRLIETGPPASSMYDARSQTVADGPPRGRLVDGQV